jgi:SAM-dependent methyltransferase
VPSDDAARYGDRWADVYDRVHAGLDPTAAVEAVSALAGGGPVLELGIGTGRIALPLARRGVEVEGVEASTRMVARLREKPGGADVPVEVADFADVRLGRRFAVVLLAFNTLFSLRTQEAQTRCFQTAAAHLAEDGRFVVEAFVPDPRRFDDEQSVRAAGFDGDQAALALELHDPVAQTVDSARLVIGADGFEVLPILIRYAWPSELDLMARIAGLALEARWENWDRRPFTGASRTHVSVYRPVPSGLPPAARSRPA